MIAEIQKSKKLWKIKSVKFPESHSRKEVEMRKIREFIQEVQGLISEQASRNRNRENGGNEIINLWNGFKNRRT